MRMGSKPCNAGSYPGLTAAMILEKTSFKSWPRAFPVLISTLGGLGIRGVLVISSRSRYRNTILMPWNGYTRRKKALLRFLIASLMVFSPRIPSGGLLSSILLPKKLQGSPPSMLWGCTARTCSRILSARRTAPSNVLLRKGTISTIVSISSRTSRGKRSRSFVPRLLSRMVRGKSPGALRYSRISAN